MRFIYLDNYLLLNMFSITTIKNIIIRFGELDKKTFSVAMLTDYCESSVIFNYPTDMTENQARLLIQRITNQLEAMPINNLKVYLNQEWHTPTELDNI